MIFRQLFESDTSTYSYLLGCERSGKAVLGEVPRYLALLDELQLRLVYTFDTAVPANRGCGRPIEPRQG